MDKHIPIALQHRPEIVIHSAPIAQALGLDVAAFQRLLEDRTITQLCERGTDEDAGTYRASLHSKWDGGNQARFIPPPPFCYNALNRGASVKEKRDFRPLKPVAGTPIWA